MARAQKALSAARDAYVFFILFPVEAFRYFVYYINLRYKKNELVVISKALQILILLKIEIMLLLLNLSNCCLTIVTHGILMHNYHLIRLDNKSYKKLF